MTSAPCLPVQLNFLSSAAGRGAPAGLVAIPLERRLMGHRARTGDDDDWEAARGGFVCLCVRVCACVLASGSQVRCASTTYSWAAKAACTDLLPRSSLDHLRSRLVRLVLHVNRCKRFKSLLQYTRLLAVLRILCRVAKLQLRPPVILNVWLLYWQASNVT